MALPSSGTITMGQIREELKQTGAISLGSTECRNLAGVSSGAIKMSDFYGKSSATKKMFKINASENYIYVDGKKNVILGYYNSGSKLVGEILPDDSFGNREPISMIVGVFQTIYSPIYKFPEQIIGIWRQGITVFPQELVIEIPLISNPSTPYDNKIMLMRHEGIEGQIFDSDVAVYTISTKYSSMTDDFIYKFNKYIIERGENFYLIDEKGYF